MRGTILGVHDGRGVLIGADDKRLEFPLVEWRSAGTPFAGQFVDYIEAEGRAHSVFAIPVASGASMGGAQSTSVMLGAIALGCLALGFIIPVLPTIAAFVLGVLGANRAKQDRDENGLLLSRIAWISAVVLFVIGTITVTALVVFFGSLASLGAFHGTFD